MGFIKFMNSGAGRWLRIVAGAALIVVGVSLRGGWLVLALIGLAPLAAGVFDFCLFAPLFRLPFLGRRMRETTDGRP
ncbi:MAG: hypothetical protein NVSMB29_11110 [Candidatus Dormibacteria bacterium]